MTLKNNVLTRELWPAFCVEPLAIFNIRLEGMPGDENPAYSVYQGLWPYLRGNICYIEFDFNFLTDDGVASFEKRLSKVLDMFDKGEFMK
jgi:hypothetical protein